MAITDNLSGYWNLDEASGTRVDSSGNGNDLTDTNTVTGTTGPGSHNASLFTAVNSEELHHIHNAALDVGNVDFTIAIWCKLTTLGLSGNRVLVCQEDASQSAAAYKIYCGDDGGGNARFSAWVSPTGAESGLTIVDGTNVQPLSTGVWYLVIFWHVASTSINIQVSDNTLQTASHVATIFSSVADFQLGAGAMRGGLYLDGALAMCGFWKRVLTATERTFLYNSGNGRSFAELTASFKKRNGAQAQPRIVQRRSINIAV